MDLLHKAIEKALTELPYDLLADLVQKRLRADGVELSARELKLVRDHLRNGNLGVFTLTRNSGPHKNVSITVSDDETKKLTERIETFFRDGFSKVLEDSQSKAATLIFANLKRQWKEEHVLQEREFAGFRERLQHRWEIPYQSFKC